MATGENQSQAVIREAHLAGVRVRSGIAFCLTQDLFFLFTPGSRVPGIINEPAMGSGGDPGGRVVRNALGGPTREGSRKSVLHRLLGQIERARDSNEAGDDAPRLLPEGLFDDIAGIIHGQALLPVYAACGVSWRMGLTSTQPVPPPQPIGIFDAHSSASSRSLQSRMKYPASCSLVSANGPSVIIILPSCVRTVVAVPVGSRGSAARKTPRCVASPI